MQNFLRAPSQAHFSQVSGTSNTVPSCTPACCFCTHTSSARLLLVLSTGSEIVVIQVKYYYEVWNNPSSLTIHNHKCQGKCIRFQGWPYAIHDKLVGFTMFKGIGDRWNVWMVKRQVDLEEWKSGLWRWVIERCEPHAKIPTLLTILLNRSPKFYHVTLVFTILWPHGLRKGYFKTIPLTITLAIIPTLTPTLIPTLTLTQAVENDIFVSLAGHVTKSVFCP